MKYVIKFLFQFLMVFIMLVAASIFDIIVAVIGEFTHTYSNALFVVIFGVAGVFAAVFTLSPPEKFNKNPVPLWVMLIYNLIIGALYYFFIAVLEGGEYQLPFRSLAVMLAAASLFFYYLYATDEKKKIG